MERNTFVCGLTLVGGNSELRCFRVRELQELIVDVGDGMVLAVRHLDNGGDLAFHNQSHHVANFLHRLRDLGCSCLQCLHLIIWRRRVIN